MAFEFVAGEEAAGLVRRRAGTSLFWPLSELASDRLLGTRREIGLRVGRFFSTIAFDAAARREARVHVSRDGRFEPKVLAGLEECLPVFGREAARFFSLLHADLLAYAEGKPGGAWGALAREGDGLVIEVRARVEQLAPARPLARLLPLPPRATPPPSRS